MGEDAIYRGRTVKIGTCEEMYYLRADQAYLVRQAPNSLNAVRDRAHLRFRFPFPDEDDVAPGEFKTSERAMWLPGLKCPPEVQHGNLQFQGHGPAGTILTVLPCPNGPGATGYGRNGYSGDVGIVQQRVIGDRLVTLCMCGACGAKWRMETIEDAAAVCGWLRDRAADLRQRSTLMGYDESARRGWSRDAVTYETICARIASGYEPGAVARTFREAG